MKRAIKKAFMKHCRSSVNFAFFLTCNEKRKDEGKKILFMTEKKNWNEGPAGKVAYHIKSYTDTIFTHLKSITEWNNIESYSHERKFLDLIKIHTL